MDIEGNIIHSSVNVKVGCKRIKARSTTLVMEAAIHPMVKTMGLLA